VIAHPLDVSRIHRVEVAHLAEKNADVDDMSQVRADRLQHHREAVEDLAGPRFDVRPRQLPSGRVNTAVAPMLMKLPTLAMWLYGPIGAGVFGGVLVSTAGMAGAPLLRDGFIPDNDIRSASPVPRRVGQLDERGGLCVVEETGGVSTSPWTSVLSPAG
jgi:hypothetical protein